MFSSPVPLVSCCLIHSMWAPPLLCTHIGTGKSVLLREIIKSLRMKHRASDDAVAITASTGIAACNIGGVTLHSFGGIGLGLEAAEQLATKIKRNRKAVTRWLRTRVLIMDEGKAWFQPTLT